jgi:hypothetical protein
MGMVKSDISIMDVGMSISEAVKQSRFGIELWRHFLIAALLVALIEMFVARSGKNRVEETEGGTR